MDLSKENSLQEQDLILVPAWDKAAIAELGNRAIAVILDGEAYDETNYGQTQPMPKPR